ncbi:aldehyde dehydrogenase [Alcaligenes sp. SDU_A2]|uniref:aldehyde dehydrogenase n=1 Tax=Alcaligenes sp. SDU_A2 TaxID=3136634 RepID=UPI00311E04D1
MEQVCSYINGKLHCNNGEDLIEVFNPSSGEKLVEFMDASDDDVDYAVSSALVASKSWAATPAIERATYLTEIAREIRKRKEDIAKIITKEQGKVYGLSLVEVEFTANYMDYMAEWARRIEGEVIESDKRGESIFLLRKPIGVAAGIVAWNFPFFLLARKMAPALVAGNTIVLKSSEETPLNAMAFVQAVEAAKLPDGVFNLVSGKGNTAGARLSENPNVGIISFTGSVETGKAIMKAASQNLTKVNLELGGKAPAIVLKDANLDLAAKAIFDSRVINSGQVCNCAERVYVERPVAEEFLEKLKNLMANVKIGDPSGDEQVEMGPLINKQAVVKASAMLQRALGEGATLYYGGETLEQIGPCFFQPTILTDCHENMEIMQNEIFAPILPVQIVDSLKEAVDLANSGRYGLTSSIYTENFASAMQACKELEFGETYVNRENFEAMQGFHAGRKQSGIGGADGKHGLYEYMDTHVIYLNHGELK